MCIRDRHHTLTGNGSWLAKPKTDSSQLQCAIIAAYSVKLSERWEFRRGYARRTVEEDNSDVMIVTT